LALESVFCQASGKAGGASDKNLLDVRLRNPRHAAYGGAIDGSIAPAQQRESFFADDALENSFALQALMLLDRQERHADGVGTGSGQSESQAGALAGEKFVRNLNQDTAPRLRFRGRIRRLHGA